MPRARTKQTARKRLDDAASRSVSGARNWYDFAEPFNAAGGRKRRIARIERLGETEGQLTPQRRLVGVALARDMMRNSPQMRGLVRTIRVNVVGPDAKLVFSEQGEWFDAAAAHFNRAWARHADFVDGSSWRELLQLVVYAVAMEGDCVVVFDGGELTSGDGTGRLAVFEADQICNLDAAGWKEFVAAGHEGWHQSSGVLVDPAGRVAGVVVTGRRGEKSVPRKDALVLLRNPDDPDAAHWAIVLRKFRPRQLRGSADAIPALAAMQDAHEMTEYELQSAKRAASHYAAILEREQPVQPADMAALPDPATLSAPAAASGEGGEDGAAASAPAPSAPPVPGATDDGPGPIGDTNLARVSGGQVDFMQGVEKIEWDPANRPSGAVTDFLDYATRLAGRALGLNASYASGKAEGSYTAFRGDLVMSWRVFADLQQWLEDTLCDWVARQVIGRAVRLGLLPAAPDGWEEFIRWQWPAMPAVDEDKEQSAILKKLRNGLTTWRDQIGPAWLQHFEQLAEENAAAKRLGLPLAPLETTPGATSGAAPSNPDTP